MTVSHASKPPNRRPILGCIADDVTGATDLATNLVQGGMSVVQLLQVPTADELSRLNVDAVVVALKTRSIPAEEAVQISLEVLGVFQDCGIERVFFKYCSTFDSTSEGNIGPVAEALLRRLGETKSTSKLSATNQTVFCPAFPRTGRTVYQGHLFVFDRLLSESGMENHPLNPMTDANIVRLLQQQCQGMVGLLSAQILDGIDGSEQLSRDEILKELDRLRQQGCSLVVTDACHDGHLSQLAAAVADMPLVTGGSGIGRYLPEAYRRRGVLASSPKAVSVPDIDGRTLVLAGSCSSATLEQINVAKRQMPSMELPIATVLEDSAQGHNQVLDWARTAPSTGPILIYSSSTPDRVREFQASYGTKRVAEAIEGFFADIAEVLLTELGFRRLIVAGGETSGAVVNRLNIRALLIGAEICPGVPWTETLGEPNIALALKSGNFGDSDFFIRASELLPKPVGPDE